MKENPNIDEMLNSFIDSELTARQQIEVQRLISHDSQIAQRLRELQKCKMLVSSLPSAGAPPEMAEQIKDLLQGRTLLRQPPQRIDERQGARHLLVRKVLAAAAMIGLVAVLGTVVYTIVGPQTVTEKPAVVATADESIRQRSAAATGFKGTLELKTADFIAVDALIKKAIVDNGLLEKVSTKAQQGKSVYALSCSRGALTLLLADLEDVWAEFGSATLFVGTDQPDAHVVVDAVTPEQIVDLITIPKPRLTGDKEMTKKPATQAQDKEKVHLTIVVADKRAIVNSQ